jgi:GT2 family glycosyltransferase
MGSMPLTDIVIVSYKDEEPLAKCTASIKEHCTNYNLIIEDNSPPNPNRLFTKAVNAGIKKGEAPYIWLLSSDSIVINSMSQQALIDRFSYGKQVGIVGSMQLDPTPGMEGRISHCGTRLCFPAGAHKNGWLSMGHGRIPEKQTWVNGASMMIRRAMVDEIGLLDESMVLVYSESDYAYYCRSKGYEVWYEPLSRVYHVLSASKTVTEWHKKDMEAFMRKWGIGYNPETKSFIYSDVFQRLDMFP